MSEAEAPLSDRPEIVFVGGPAHGRAYRLPPGTSRWEVPRLREHDRPPADGPGFAPIIDLVSYHRFQVQAEMDGKLIWIGFVMLCRDVNTNGPEAAQLLEDALKRTGLLRP